jgi:phosphate transport system substrate-binding protein
MHCLYSYRSVHRALGPGGFVVLAWFLALNAVIAHAAEIRIGGAGTTLGTMKELGEAYEKRTRGVKVTVDKKSKASVGGVRSLLKDELDIAISTRKLSEADIAGVGKLRATEVARVPFVFAVQAATKVTDATSAEMLQIYQLRKLTWSDGSNIVLYPRTANVSDTLFLMDISPEWKTAIQAINSNPKIQKYDTAQEAAALVESRPGALTTSTLALLQTENRRMRPLRIDGVEPTAATVQSGQYQYVKPVILITASARSPEVQAFIEFVCSAAGQKILSDTGHVVILKKNDKC